MLFAVEASSLRPSSPADASTRPFYVLILAPPFRDPSSPAANAQRRRHGSSGFFYRRLCRLPGQPHWDTWHAWVVRLGGLEGGGGGPNQGKRAGGRAIGLH